MTPLLTKISKVKIETDKWKCKVDKFGRFLLEDVPPGPCSILYYRDHDVSVRRFEIPNTPSSDIVLDLSSAVITGRVIDKNEGTPVKNVMVYAEMTSEPRNGRPLLMTNSEGEFKIELLDPGEYRVSLITSLISIETPRFVPLAGQNKMITVKDGAVAELNFALDHGAEGEIEVVDQAGKPVRAGHVHALVALNDPSQAECTLAAQTDRKGLARLIGIPPGDYVAKLSVNNNINRFVYSSATTIELGKPFKIRVVVEDPVELKMDATDVAGEPISLHTVKVYDSLDRLVATSGTHSGKPEIIVRVPRGKLRIWAQTGELVGAAEIDLSDGKAQPLHLHLQLKNNCK
ncbi:MAG: carboxypeptidase regulatory-like domain-containing protein [Planctomycetota bacterium]